MAKPPDPQVQFRNIREAWARLGDDNRLAIAEELFGPLCSERVVERPVEVDSCVSLEELFERLSYGEKLATIDRLFMGFAASVNLDVAFANTLLIAADAVRDLKLAAS